MKKTVLLLLICLILPACNSNKINLNKCFDDVYKIKLENGVLVC